MNSLPAATNRIAGISRKSVQNLGGVSSYGYAPTGGYDNSWGNKIGVRSDVIPTSINRSAVW